MRDGTGSEPCGSSVVILDLHRLRISSFQLKQCGSILSIAWAGDNAIAAVCHINPSLSEYIETDVSTGVTTRDLLGYDFTRSPSGTKVAHVGWIVDFATPYAQSNYLQIDHTTVYPLPSGSGPVEQKTLEQPPQIVYRRGSTYSGIHEFMHGLAWSPDSGRIALVDCTYDWTPNHPTSLYGSDGRESNRDCSLVAVSTGSLLEVIPLTDIGVDSVRQSRLTWLDLHRVSLRAGSVTRVIDVR